MWYTVGVMNKSSELDVCDVMGIVLIMLKVFGVEPVAHWPWLLVLLPFLLPVLVMALAVGYVKLIFWFAKNDSKKNNKEKNSEQVH